MSLLEFKRHIAVFIDENGDKVGQKTIYHSFGNSTTKKKTFNYNNGTYNIKKKALSLLIKTPTIFFDSQIYVYRIGHPDPLDYNKGSLDPLFTPDLYKTLLENKQTIDLIKAGRGGLNIDWRWIVGGIVVLLILYYIFSPDKTQAQPLTNVITQNVTRPIEVMSGAGVR